MHMFNEQATFDHSRGQEFIAQEFSQRCGGAGIFCVATVIVQTSNGPTSYTAIGISGQKVFRERAAKLALVITARVEGRQWLYPEAELPAVFRQFLRQMLEARDPSTPVFLACPEHMPVDESPAMTLVPPYACPSGTLAISLTPAPVAPLQQRGIALSATNRLNRHASGRASRTSARSSGSGGSSARANAVITTHQARSRSPRRGGLIDARSAPENGSEWAPGVFRFVMLNAVEQSLAVDHRNARLALGDVRVSSDKYLLIEALPCDAQLRRAPMRVGEGLHFPHVTLARLETYDHWRRDSNSHCIWLGPSGEEIDITALAERVTQQLRIEGIAYQTHSVAMFVEADDNKTRYEFMGGRAVDVLRKLQNKLRNSLAVLGDRVTWWATEGDARLHVSFEL